MKRIFFTIALAISATVNAQIQTPMLSPLAKMEQTVGLTNIAVEYSRPQKNDRKVFPDVVPYGQIWRAGANKNSILKTDDKLIFGKDTLAAGSYSMFVQPDEKQWTLYFYTTTENWGVPADFSKDRIALQVTAKTEKTASTVENFTIAFENITINDAVLNLSWDNTSAAFPFKVTTDVKMKSNIKKALNGPTANDYYRSADYLYNSNGDMKEALAYMEKAITLFGDAAPFHVYRKLALIQANLGQYNDAIKTATKSTELAKKAGNNEYVKMNDASIKEWSKKK